ncbi:unnamed protein product [Moneuplotes crassus]|uniref:Uncharacterized protein n=1 Tax=Euplotes crassus TaxID=5936 RepID=A0AAD2D4T4_EUPCR|nr:unnamed protein product [Moneuplotes crassus]
MKLLLSFILVCIIAKIRAAGVLVNESSYVIEMLANQTHTNGSNTDILLRLTTPSTIMTANQYITIACIDTGFYNYSLSEDKTSLKMWTAEWQCDGTCTAISHITSFTWRSGGAAYTHAGYVYHTTEATPQITAKLPSTNHDTENGNSPTLSHYFTGMTPSLLSQFGLPNQSQKFYYRCFSRFDNAASALFDAAVANIPATLPISSNFTLDGHSLGMASVIAVFGLIVPSLM